MQKIKKKEAIIVVLFCIAIFLLIYSPHFSNPYPLYIDEWQHITEALKLKNSEYSGYAKGHEIGFHVFLMLISFVSDIVLIYKFLPALFAVLSSLALFYFIKKKTGSFWLGLFSMLFFASIKSNINLSGLWFFIPLTFSIPLIYLYFHFFTQGIENQNKKLILASLGIMLVLVFVHAISLSFAIPILLIYSFLHKDYIKKEYKFFSLFLLVPVVLVLFYSLLMKTPIFNATLLLIKMSKFDYGWNNTAINNSFLEVYSLIGLALATIGISCLLHNKEARKKYSIFIIWPIVTFLYIIFYKVIGFSLFSPYQRNMYYFALSLPFLSAAGLQFILSKAKAPIRAIRMLKNKEAFANLVYVLILIATIFLTFFQYYTIHENLQIPARIDESDYNAIKFLSTQPKGNVMAKLPVSMAIYPVSQQNPLATGYFYGDTNIIKTFFNSTDCNTKQQIISQNNVNYIISRKSINCGWQIIYNQNNQKIYKIE